MGTSKTAMQVLLELYDYHTTQFYNVIEGISDENAMDRLGTKANHVAWLAGSLVYERYALIDFFGAQTDYKPNELFVGHKGIQDDVKYPSLDEYRKDWELLSPILKTAIEQAEPEKLNGPEPYGMGENISLFDALFYCLDRESYCIGQIGLYRRLLGYPAMKYS